MVKIGNDSDKWKMLRLEPEINEIVFKLKGWHLQRGKKVTNSDVVKELILKEAKRKGIINNHHPNKQHREKKDGGSE